MANVRVIPTGSLIDVQTHAMALLHCLKEDLKFVGEQKYFLEDAIDFIGDDPEPRIAKMAFQYLVKENYVDVFGVETDIRDIPMDLFKDLMTGEVSQVYSLSSLGLGELDEWDQEFKEKIVLLSEYLFESQQDKIDDLKFYSSDSLASPPDDAALHVPASDRLVSLDDNNPVAESIRENLDSLKTVTQNNTNLDFAGESIRGPLSNEERARSSVYLEFMLKIFQLKETTTQILTDFVLKIVEKMEELVVTAAAIELLIQIKTAVVQLAEM